MAAPASGQSAARQNGTAKGSGRRKHVASAAGAARYGKPVGSEIGGPRDANHAAIQQDQGARKNYGDLVNGDQAAQRKALDGMSTDDLNKLADIAYSFKSSDPKVVALRIAARNAQARRGIRVPVGQTQTVPAKGPTGGKAAPPMNRSNRGATKALSAVGPNSARLIELAGAAKPKNTSKLGNFPIPDTAHLRKAVQAIGRAKPEHRPVIARHILARAKALNAEHMVGDHIKHYALGHRQPGTIGMSRAEQEAIELAGRWKHGYIPLDAEAMASKMKGGKGKPWWTGPGHSSGGASKALHGSPKSGSPGDSGKLTKVVKSEVPKTAPRGAKVKVNKLETPAGKSPTAFGAEYAQKHGADKARAEAAKLRAGSPDKIDLRLAVALESAAGEPRGAKVTNPPMDKKLAKPPTAASVGNALKKAGFSKSTSVKAATNHRGQQVGSGSRTAGYEVRKGLKAGEIEVRIESAHRGSSRGLSPQDAARRKTEEQRFVSALGASGFTVTKQGEWHIVTADAHGDKLPGTKPKVGTTSATDVNKVSSGTPADLASKYVQMHGTAGARRKVGQLMTKKLPTARDKELLAALKAALSS